MELNENYQPDTAIVGLWFGLNYGSILSAYALYKTVEDMGYQPCFLNKPVGFWGERYSNPKSIAGKFIHKHCYVSPEFHDGKALFEFMSARQNFIAGSDVLWNYEICGKTAGGFFFLDFVPAWKNKISYASSFGSGFTASGHIKKHTEELLRKIPKRSVGDLKSLEILNLQFHMDAELVLDPLFLTDCYDFAGSLKPEIPCLFAYLENCDSQKRKMLKKAEEIRECRTLNYADINNYEMSSQKFGMDVEYPVSVEEWVSSMKNAEFVITDSYYTMCLAIIFEKPFIVLAPKCLPDLGRYTDLLEKLGLSERLVYVEDDMADSYYLLRKPIKYELVNKKLTVYRETSRDWLLHCLENTSQEN